MVTDSPFRYALASARRLYLHWTQVAEHYADKAMFKRFEDDFSRVIKDFEMAVDEIDRLDAVINTTVLELRALAGEKK